MNFLSNWIYKMYRYSVNLEDEEKMVIAEETAKKVCVCVCPIVSHVCLKETSTNIYWVPTMRMAKSRERNWTHGEMLGHQTSLWDGGRGRDQGTEERTCLLVRGQGSQEKGPTTWKKFERPAREALARPAVQNPGWGYSFPLSKSRERRR